MHGLFNCPPRDGRRLGELRRRKEKSGSGIASGEHGFGKGGSEGKRGEEGRKNRLKRTRIKSEGRVVGQVIAISYIEMRMKWALKNKGDAGNIVVDSRVKWI